MSNWRQVGTGLLAAVTMSVMLTACLGGPEGSPGLSRLHILQKDAFYAAPLPAGYKVLSESVTVPKWDSNGYPFGQPGWNSNDIVSEKFATSASQDQVVAYFDRRAKQTGWEVDAKGTMPTLGSWGWSKRFHGFVAGASISAGNGYWLFLLGAPPKGPTT